jgi:hypothetical protein
MSYIFWANIGAGGERKAAGFDEELGGLFNVELVAHPGTRHEQKLLSYVKELRFCRIIVEGKFGDYGMPSVDTRHIEGRADEALSEPAEAWLGGENVAHLLLNENRRGNYGLERSQRDGHELVLHALGAEYTPIFLKSQRGQG